MSIADKLTTIAENVQKVFKSGKNVGVEEWFDKYQTGTSPNHMARYAGFGWTDETYNPIRPIYTDLVSHMIFNYSQITDTKVDIEIHSASNNVFQGADKLKTIRKLIVSNKTVFNAWFNNCVALQNITFEGEIASTINFQWSPLTVESMKSVISCLANYSGTANEGTQKVTFTESCWAALEADSSSPSGGTWKDYVNELGWLY